MSRLVPYRNGLWLALALLLPLSSRSQEAAKDPTPTLEASTLSQSDAQ